jgi:alkaline phosphatase D
MGVTAPVALWPAATRCDSDPVAFRHGVASGDPTSQAVILWTRVSPASDTVAQAFDVAPPFEVTYRIGTDPHLRRSVRTGRTTTNKATDFTVKVDVTGLAAGRTYYYQFSCFGVNSPIGRTRTLPSGAVSRLRIAVASCSNYPYGYFTAYRRIAERADLDLVLHLGDYLYEYGNGTFGDGTALGRVSDPLGEIVTLSDYRRRHAQYKGDPDLQEAHRQHPFVAVWDDHEITNDAWRDGAENHQPDTEGNYADRKAAAIQAYFEWMPVRRPVADRVGRIYRAFDLGDLASLVVLDTRHFGRDQQVDGCTNDVTAANRQLLGAEQEAWVTTTLQRSRARYRLIAQQVMVAQLLDVRQQPPCPFNSDQWDGYPAARARLLAQLAAAGNSVVLTGDIHSSWANELTLNPFDPSAYDGVTGRGSAAVEFVTPGVTSPGIEDPATAAGLTALVRATHPHIKYTELTRRGYVLLDVTPERVQGEWYHLASITEPNAAESFAAGFSMAAGSARLVPVLQPSAAVANAPAFAPAVPI